jgi:hypothetical protein
MGADAHAWRSIEFVRFGRCEVAAPAPKSAKLASVSGRNHANVSRNQDVHAKTQTKQVSLPKTAALTKAQAEHKAWLKAHGIKVTKNTLRR